MKFIRKKEILSLHSTLYTNCDCDLEVNDFRYVTLKQISIFILYMHLWCNHFIEYYLLIDFTLLYLISTKIEMKYERISSMLQAIQLQLK